MNSRRLPLLPIAAACAVLATPPTPAYAADPLPCVKGESESRDRSAVDDGEIRFTDETVYDDARKFAISAWQYSGTKIKILGDSATTVNDLEFRDENLGSGRDAPVGEYRYRAAPGFTDYIVFNKQRMGKDADYGRHVALHELGHALGLCHKPEGKVATLMWKEIRISMNRPQDADKANHKKLWG
ncbi:hypothetical protein [Streptomyces sp. Isolate_45]|uniref:hypothetical protein n=1 Tax=Streptomyces sp. Isolate_45 TaxID=2950111 RepID=UPI002481D800|nr:hypothetical protein [Streptomyces sp. Isolate_45]MDA5280012.1 hypothetical protein [Streptomyces sp. Isolate_45]